MTDPAVTRLVREIIHKNPPRIWSLLVTLFGDLAQEQDAKLSGGSLKALFEIFEIKFDALRVALFRLRKDGWITSTRVGRKSFYALTELGRAECLRANPIIYGPPPHVDGGAYLIIFSPSHSVDKTQQAPLYRINGHLWVSSSPVLCDGVLSLELKECPIPDWISNSLCPPDLVQASICVWETLLIIEKNLPNLSNLSAIHIAVLRSLIVHDWRRVALKAPQLPEFLFPKDWKGSECRRLVQTLLARLDPPDIHQTCS